MCVRIFTRISTGMHVFSIVAADGAARPELIVVDPELLSQQLVYKRI